MGALNFEVSISVSENGRRAPEWTLDSDLNGNQTLEDLLKYCKTSLIVIADTALREEQANGFDKDPVVTVDGIIGKPVIEVNPLGKIWFTSRQQAMDILYEAYLGVWERSPVDTGNYRKNNVVFWNNTLVVSDPTAMESWIKSNPSFKPGDEIVIVNTTPYARKMERFGVTADSRHPRTVKSHDKYGRFGHAGRILAPNGAYYLTYRQISRKFKQNVSIKFEFIPGSRFGLHQRFKTRVENRWKPDYSGKVRVTTKLEQHQMKRTYLYPSIKFVITEGGTF